jgi:two-component sensor histidine kinase
MQIAIHDTSDGSVRGFGPYDDCDFEEHLLLQELTHRINNELASTIGFVTLTAAQSNSAEVKIALAGVIQHVHESARIYRALQMPTTNNWIDAAEYMRELCQSISRAKLQYRDIELVFLESPLKLNAFRCWRLGMIVSELIANASRHAFCGGRGKIQVELRNRGDYVECSVTDNGSGLVSFGRPGQGLKIIRSLACGLGGKINHRFGACGTMATLSFPLVEVEPGHVEGNRLDLTMVGPR